MNKTILITTLAAILSIPTTATAQSFNTKPDTTKRLITNSPANKDEFMKECTKQLGISLLRTPDLAESAEHYTARMAKLDQQNIRSCECSYKANVAADKKLRGMGYDSMAQIQQAVKDPKKYQQIVPIIQEIDKQNLQCQLQGK